MATAVASRSHRKKAPPEAPTNPLDKADDERSTSGNVARPYGLQREKLREIFLGDAVSAGLAQGPSLLLLGPEADDPASLLPFLYFHPSVTIQVCAGCRINRHPEGLIPFLERGLVQIALIDEFARTPARFREVARRFPELVIGPRSYWEYRYYSLNEAPHGGAHRHWCPGCIDETVDPLLPRIDGFTSSIKQPLVSAVRWIHRIPEHFASVCADRLVEVCDSPSVAAAEELQSTVAMGYYLTSVAALGGVPQASSDRLSAAGGLVDSLRIDTPQGVNIGSFLDVLARYRGTLSAGRIPADPADAVAVATEINGEVARIASSRRAVLHGIFARVGPGVASVSEQAIHGGTYGAEAARAAGSAIVSTSWGKRVWASFLAKCYYRVSTDAIQVWQIRRDLKAISPVRATARPPGGSRR